MIKAPTLDYAAVIKAFDAGEFYCSTGPEIYDYYLEGDNLCINCSPVQYVYLKSTAISASARTLSQQDDITHVEFDLKSILSKKTEPFFRIEIADSKRKMAFTNPLFLP